MSARALTGFAWKLWPRGFHLAEKRNAAVRVPLRQVSALGANFSCKVVVLLLVGGLAERIAGEWLIPLHQESRTNIPPCDTMCVRPDLSLLTRLGDGVPEWRWG